MINEVKNGFLEAVVPHGAHFEAINIFPVVESILVILCIGDPDQVERGQVWNNVGVRIAERISDLNDVKDVGGVDEQTPGEVCHDGVHFEFKRAL